MIELEISPCSKIVIRWVATEGYPQPKVDARIWLKFPNQDDFIPTRKGLFLLPETWERVIKEVSKVLISKSHHVSSQEVQSGKD